MQVRLLGPVDVVVHGEPRPLHGLRRKAVLAVLALHGGEIVSTDYLADAVWGEDAPPTAVNTLQSHVSYLRGVLGTKTAILARPPGYVLELPGDGTDVQLAERLLREGTQQADPAEAVRHLEDALDLWRGQPLADVADLAWLSAQTERLDLLRMRIRQALSEARLAAGEHALLSVSLLRRGLWREQASACLAALDAARRTGDMAGEAHCLQRLAVGYAKSGRISQSQPLFEDALRLFEVLGDHYCQAISHRTLLWIASRQEQPLEMLARAQRCYEEFLSAGHQAGQALALQDTGHAYAKLGNYEEAIAHCERALVTLQSSGQRALEGAVWDTLGNTHHLRGDYPQAIACYQRAVDLAREIADPFNEADVLNSLGDAHRSAGDLTAARRAWTQALRIFDEIDHPDRDQVRAKLRVDDHAATAGRQLAAQSMR